MSVEQYRRTNGATCVSLSTLQWRHNEGDGVSNHQPHDCLFNVYSGTDQIKHQRCASLAFVRGIHRWPVNSPHKGPVTRKMFPFDDVIMNYLPDSSRKIGISRLSQYLHYLPTAVINGNGLLSDATQPLSEPMWHITNEVRFELRWGQFSRKCIRNHHCILFE